MKLILYNNHSENNNINKTIVKIVKLDGTLREATSLIDPQIMIQLDPKNFDGTIVDDSGTYVMFNGIKITWDNFIYNNVLSANYMYIPDFNRYYFINDIVSFRNNLWLIQSHVDVICSYKNEILKTVAYVSRNEFTFNDKLMDDLRCFEYPKTTQYLDIDNDFEVDEFFQSYMYLVATEADDAVYQREWPITRTDNIGENLRTKFNRSLLGCDENILFYARNDIYGLLRSLYQDKNLQTYIKYIKIYPFSFEQTIYDDIPFPPETYVEGKWTRNYHVGNKNDIFESGGHLLTMPKYTIDIKKVADFQLDNFYEYSNDYKDSEPYKVIELWIPFYNYIKLPYHKIHNHRLQLYYITSIGDGSTTAILYDESDDKQLFSSKVECGMDISLTSTSNYENEKRKDGLMMSTAIGTLSSVVSTAIGVLTHNPVMTAGGVMSGVKTVTNAITTANQIFDTASVGVTSTISGWYNSAKPFLRITKQEPVDVNLFDYAKINGKPLKEFYKLGDLSGFTIVEDEHLENFGSCLKTESVEIKEILKNGIIL